MRFRFGRALLVLTSLPVALAGGAFGSGAVKAVGTTPNLPWKGLPTRTSVNPHSGAGDAINVAFESSGSQILADFVKMGWLKADPLSPRNDERLAVAALHHGKYPTAPVSKQYLFGRIEDFAVERENGSVAMRDHARFWDTGKKDPNTHLELWIGAASRDIGIKIVKKHTVLIGTTHRIDGHIDTERALIVTSMQKVGVVSTVIMEPGVGPVTNMRTGGGDLLTTDGKAALIVLR